jgi:hypothetical protein
MKRRGFLGFLGGAAVAGPSMAKQAVAGVEAMALPSLAVDAPTASWGGSLAGIPINGGDNHGDWLKEQIAEVIGITAAERQERIAGMHVSHLDPDLALNRSMALWVKIREQKRRNYEREHTWQLRNYRRQLADWLKHQALS